MRSVVVTGASGFVGAHVSASLEAHGKAVKALLRKGGQLPGWTRVREIVRIANLGDADRLREAFAGADAVVHAAGRAHVSRGGSPDSERAFHAVNVEATRTVARAAASAGVRTFVYISSIAAGVAEGYTTDDENPRTLYGRSKREGELAAGEEMDRVGGRCVHLRPPMIYGPGMRGAPLELFKWLDRGIPVPLGGVGSRRSTAYVGNVAEAVRFLLDRGDASGVFTVSDTELVSVRDFARAAASALGKQPRLLPIPLSVFRGGARLADALGVLIPMPVSLERVERSLGELVVRGERLRNLGFIPPFSMVEGLAQSAQWLRERNE